MDLTGSRVTWDGTVGFGITFTDGGVLSTHVNDRRERLDEPFVVRQGVTVPVADYHTRDASVNYSSSDGRSLSGTVGVSGGEYYDGSRFTVSGSLSWQPDYHLTLQASASHNAIAVQAGRFNADLYTGRLRYAFSTTLNVMAFVQYNADADQVVTNVRLNYIHAPLSDLFLVFTERRDIAPGRSGVLERFITLKVTKLLAF